MMSESVSVKLNKFVIGENEMQEPALDAPVVFEDPARRSLSCQTDRDAEGSSSMVNSVEFAPVVPSSSDFIAVSEEKIERDAVKMKGDSEVFKNFGVKGLHQENVLSHEEKDDDSSLSHVVAPVKLSVDNLVAVDAPTLPRSCVECVSSGFESTVCGGVVQVENCVKEIVTREQLVNVCGGIDDARSLDAIEEIIADEVMIVSPDSAGRGQDAMITGESELFVFHSSSVEGYDKAGGPTYNFDDKAGELREDADIHAGGHDGDFDVDDGFAASAFDQVDDPGGNVGRESFDAVVEAMDVRHASVENHRVVMEQHAADMLGRGLVELKMRSLSEMLKKEGIGVQDGIPELEIDDARRQLIMPPVGVRSIDFGMINCAEECFDCGQSSFVENGSEDVSRK